MLRFGMCDAGPEHAKSGSAWESTERATSLRLAEGSFGVHQAVLVGPILPSN